MKNFYNIKVLLLVCLLATFGFLQSCNDDEEEANSGNVELLSFGPTGAKHGDKLKFIGHNLNKVESIEFVGASVAKTQFTSQTSELIELVVPQAAEEGKITLKVSGGEDVVSKTVLSFEVPVSIASVTSEAKPGTNITVTGNYLNWVDSVQFGTLQDSIVTTFVSKTMTELVVRVPMSAKTGSLTFFTGGTEPMAIETEGSLVVTLPKVTALAPSLLKHGENLTITGTDLDLVREVKFMGVGAANVSSFVSQSATSLVVKVPDNTKKGTLTLVVPSMEEVTTTQEVDIILPAITGVSPTPVTEGANLTITGTNLDLVKEILFPGVTAGVSAFVSQSPTQIVVKVPTGAINGTLKFKTTKNFEVITTGRITFPGSGPAPLKYTLYSDALSNGWQEWTSGGGKPDLENTEQVFNGTKAVKVPFSAWGSWGGGFSPTNAPAGNYTEFTFWVYGGTGVNGKVRLIVNPGTWDDRTTFNVVAGKWTEVTIPLSTFRDNDGKTNPATWTDIRFQAEGAINGPVWFDYIGFR